MTLPESRKYYRPCGEAFQKYGGDLNVQGFGDRLCEIDDALYAADVIIDRLRDALIEIMQLGDVRSDEAGEIARRALK